MNWLKMSVLGLWLTCLPASAQMAESLRSEFHKQEELGVQIIKSGEQSSLLAALKDPKVRVLVLQLFEGDLDGPTATLLLDWVRKGNSLWFYDARLGPFFGFEPLLLKKDQFTNRPESGEYAGAKREGVATTALAMGGHVVNTGVGQVSAFLPKMGETYSAVNVTADTVPLLRFTHQSPALAALRREGRGLVVFKPLLWPEALSGDRFQSNLLEFSAGFQVPGPAGEGKTGNPPGPSAEFVQGKPARPLEQAAIPQVVEPPTPTVKDPVPTVANASEEMDQIEVVGEGSFQGLLLTEKLRFETGTSSLQLHRNEVEFIELGLGGQLDVVHFRDGRLSKGLLMQKKIEFEIRGGDTRELQKRDLRMIRWGKSS